MDDHCRRMRAAAIGYARLGLHVFPLVPGTKSPFRGSHAELDASDNPELIGRWWTDDFRGANIGWALRFSAGCFVLDVDERSGGAEWLALHEPLPDTVRVQTPSRGLGGHHWLGVTPALATASLIGLARQYSCGPQKIEDSVDIKGLQTGFVVLPPSTIKSKGRYYFEGGCSPLEQEIASCPAWLEAEIMAHCDRARTRSVHERSIDPSSFYFGRLFQELGTLGPEVRAGVWAVQCPNAEQHSGKRRKPYSGDTVICAPDPGSKSQRGWFHCAHAHCIELQSRLLP